MVALAWWLGEEEQLICAVAHVREAGYLREDVDALLALSDPLVGPYCHVSFATPVL